METCLDMILKEAKSVIILDHHKSAKAKVEYLIENKICPVVFDMNRSAATITWKHYNGDSPCILANYVEDRDIWRWALPDSDKINEALYTDNYFENFWRIEALHQSLVNNPVGVMNELISVGKGAMAYKMRLIESFAYKAIPATLKAGPQDNPRVLNALMLNVFSLSSDVGNYVMTHIAPLYEEKGWRVDLAALYHIKIEDDIVIISVRTTKDDVDLSVLLKSIWGGIPGGGHAKAGAFTIAGSDLKTVFTMVDRSTFVIDDPTL